MDTAAGVEEEAEEGVEGTEMEAESGGTEVAALGDTVQTLTRTEVDNVNVPHLIWRAERLGCGTQDMVLSGGNRLIADLWVAFVQFHGFNMHLEVKGS